jgi:hypothetical protein
LVKKTKELLRLSQNTATYLARLLVANSLGIIRQYSHQFLKLSNNILNEYLYDHKKD